MKMKSAMTTLYRIDHHEIEDKVSQKQPRIEKKPQLEELLVEEKNNGEKQIVQYHADPYETGAAGYEALKLSHEKEVQSQSDDGKQKWQPSVHFEQIEINNPKDPLSDSFRSEKSPCPHSKQRRKEEKKPAEWLVEQQQRRIEHKAL